MKRFAISEWENEDGQMEQGGLEEDAVFGDYVRYEDVEPIVADRDIKAANLRLLVEKVLAYDTEADLLEDHEEGGGVDHVEIMTAYDRMVRLARGLKQ